MDTRRLSHKLTIVCIVVILMTMMIMTVGCSEEENCITIKYETNGGSPIEDSVIDLFGAINIDPPHIPMRENYNFEGWYEDSELKYPYEFPGFYISNMTLYAKWSPCVYNITLQPNGGDVENLTSYDNRLATVLPTPTREGFCFAGWYTDSTFTSNTVSTLPEKTMGDKQFYAKWLHGDYAIALNKNGGVCEDIDNAKYGETQTLPTDITKDGYTFKGWYASENFDGEPIETITNSSKGIVNVYAKWEKNSYSIKLYNSLDTSSPLYELDYKFDDEIVLPTPENMPHMTFEGWYTDENLEHKFALDKMPSNDIVLYAKYIPCLFVTLSSYGEEIMTTPVFDGKYSPIDIVASQYNKPDFEFDGWYLDKSYTTPCDGTISISDDTTLYAKWIPYGFFRYEEEWTNTLKNNGVIHVKDQKQLTYLIEYCIIKDYEHLPFALDYISKRKSPNVYEEITNVSCESIYSDACRIECTYDYNSKNLVLDRYEPFRRDDFIAVDPEGKKLLSMETPIVNPPQITNKRADDFDDFKYQKYELSYEVEYSDELYYTLLYGLKPIPKPNSPAESLLNKSKAILREICDDNMSDKQKMYSIYYWIAKNIRYDYKALKVSNKKKFSCDAWALEGPLNNKTGVCASISMLYVVLARLEGITTVQTCGSNTKGKDPHAWNKTYIDGNGDGSKEWYIIDATWASIPAFSKGSSFNYNTTFLSNDKFLFTDEERVVEDKYVQYNNALSFINMHADTSIKKGTGIYWGDVKDEKHDLYVSSTTELLYIIDHVISKNIDYKEDIALHVEIFTDDNFMRKTNFYGLLDYEEILKDKYKRDISIRIDVYDEVPDIRIINIELKKK